MAKIMLVEDDNNLREIYGARLMAEGYEIVSAQDGEEALAIAVKEKPDLIISDVMMPRISGFDMLDILRNAPETKDTKVIMMTALSQAEDKSRADKLGADRYLVKSQVTLEDVTNAVHEVLGDIPADGAAPAADNTAQPAEVAAPTPEPAPTASAQPAGPQPEIPTVDAIANPDIKVVDEPNPGEVQAPPAPEPVETIAPAVTDSPAVQPPVIPAPDPAQFQPVTAAPTPVTATPATNDDPQTPASDQTIPTAPPTPAAPAQAVTDDIALPPVVEPTKSEEVKPADIKVELPAPAAPPTPEPSAPPVDPALTEVAVSEPSVGPNLAEALAAEEQQVGGDQSSIDATATVSESTAPTIANGASTPTVVAPTKIEVTAPEETAAPEESTNPATPDKKATGERVIQPLNDPASKPDLEALLAAEEQKEAVNNPAVSSVIPPASQNESPSKPSTDLNNIAI
jgi:CheY-like chemotaxis protein